MRVLGLDFGDRRIGVAISDPEQILATPLATITRDNDQDAVDAILRLVHQRDIKRIVIGMPYSLNGSIGDQARKIIDFREKLAKRTEISIAVWDERLSTVAAERLLRQADTKRAKRRTHRDAVAAAFILQGYLDSLKVRDQ